MIIIPDIHGRTFWKEAVKDKNDKIIFLGDYVDPFYDEEGIDTTTTILNLLDIIDFKKKNPDQVILLLGEHDFMYMDAEHVRRACRHNYLEEPRITGIYMDNKDLFDILYSQTINDKLYIFSHAGIISDWLIKYKKLFGEFTSIKDSLPKINELFKNWDKKFIKSLLDVSEWNMGDERFGSIIWADVREHIGKELDGINEEGIYQIFGHTFLKNKPIIMKSFAALDHKKAFVLDEKTGEIKNG